MTTKTKAEKPTAAPAHVPVEKWGKDHWSLLAYVETLCVDSSKKGIGEIDKRRVRCNENRHTLHAVNYPTCKWQSSYGTRLQGYWAKDGRTVPAKLMKDHDDWDCLSDLDAAGMVEVISEANGFVKLTQRGSTVAGALRAYKAQGGVFADFKWVDPKPVRA